ncbi:MAG TPA: helix-turn-helix domain-containing protein, partial [Anaerovoracaceae bacterium]|nr:helix-turn-helix domain-containing protein [Anaerovoracaceae bacterium]
YLILLDIDNYKFTDGQIEALRNQLQAFFINCVSFCYESDVVVLVESGLTITEFQASVSSAEAMLKKKNLKAVISDQFSDFYELPCHFRHAKQAQQFLNALTPGQTVGSYNDVRLLDLLLSQPTQSNFQQFIDQEARAIYQYDKTHSTEFFETLYHYLSYGRSLQKTAEKLHIHKNTVTYRISRIKEMFGIDLDDYQLCIRFHYAYLLIQLFRSELLPD